MDPDRGLRFRRPAPHIGIPCEQADGAVLLTFEKNGVTQKRRDGPIHEIPGTQARIHIRHKRLDSGQKETPSQDFILLWRF